MTQVRLREPAAARVIFVGQSILTIPAPPLDACSKAMTGLQTPFVSIAHAGVGWTYNPLGLSLTQLAPTDLLPQVRNRDGCDDILVMLGGQADIIDPAAPTGAQVYARAVAYKDIAVGYGITKTVMCTIPAIGPNALALGIPTGPQATVIADYKAAVLANTGGFDAVADCSVYPMNDATNGAYFSNDFGADPGGYRLHVTAGGAAAIGEIIAATLGPLL